MKSTCCASAHAKPDLATRWCLALRRDELRARGCGCGCRPPDQRARLKDKGNSKMAKDKVTVVHSPFNSLADEEDCEPVEVRKVVVGAGVGGVNGGGGGGGGKKKQSNGGTAKKNATQEERGKTGKPKKKQESTGTAAPEELTTEWSNPALMIDSPRADAATAQDEPAELVLKRYEEQGKGEGKQAGAENGGKTGSSDEEQGARNDQAGEKSGKKSRMIAYLEKKDQEDRAKAAEAKKRAAARRKREAKKTHVDNPFALDDSSDEDADNSEAEEEGESDPAAASRRAKPSISKKTSDIGSDADMADGDDDKRFLDNTMKSGPVHADDDASGLVADKTFKVKQTAWKGKKIRGHKVNASVSLIVSQMALRIMDGDVLVCSILYQDIHHWEVGKPLEKGGKPTIDVSLQAGSPTFAALGPLIRFVTKSPAAIASQLAHSVTEFKELSGKCSHPTGDSGSSAGTDTEIVESGDTEEGIPPQEASSSCGDDSVPGTDGCSLSNANPVTPKLDGVQHELETRDVIEDLREKLNDRDALLATLEADMAALKLENAELRASLANAQAGRGAAPE